jgi:tetratricopeptide (TPR) repeat protein
MTVEIQHSSFLSRQPERAPLRRWLYLMALSVVIPLIFFLALEFGLRWAGFGRPRTFLIPDDKPGCFRTNPDFANLFLPATFDLRPLNFRITAHKAPNTVRIVILGESAAQGVPVPSFGFAAQLRAQLRAKYPGKEIEVINTGIVAINSHVVYQIARELARFEPDLFVVYMGNNEVVGPYGPGCTYLSQMPPLSVIRAGVFARSTRIGQLVSSILGRLTPRSQHAPEWGGMSMFVDNAVPGNDPRLEAVYHNFAANLQGIVNTASRVGAKTILCTVVANLKDCPPFLSLHRPGLSAAELSAWQADFDQGTLAWRLGDTGQARTRLEAARQIDPQYADTDYMLGSLDWQAGNAASARQHFIAALHWDALRFRPDPRINQIIRETAQSGGDNVSLLDAAMAMGADPDSSAPPSGRELLFEHVHFDWNGNYRLARMMAESVATAVFGGGKSDSSWLDSSACADAVAYTPHERLPMLLRIEVLIRKPPFTHQLSYGEDEARMTRDIATATQDARMPATLSHASEVATAALARDPDNPALAGILEGIDLDRDNLTGALALARHAKELLPRDFALDADEASILARLGRSDEAEKILLQSIGHDTDWDLAGPILADFWTRTKRFDEGRRFFDHAVAQRPEDRRLRLVRAGLWRAAGDVAGAEREYRALLTEDPANNDALEALVSLLVASGRSDEAAKISVAAADPQPGNEANDLRAAKICEARNDDAGAIRFLEAAEQSGPVNATVELTLALKLYRQKCMPEMMTHLAEARTLSTYEGDPTVTASIDQLIARFRVKPD